MLRHNYIHMQATQSQLLVNHVTLCHFGRMRLLGAGYFNNSSAAIVVLETRWKQHIHAVLQSTASGIVCLPVYIPKLALFGSYVVHKICFQAHLHSSDGMLSNGTKLLQFAWCLPSTFWELAASIVLNLLLCLQWVVVAMKTECSWLIFELHRAQIMK